jgi:hypothetical protein
MIYKISFYCIPKNIEHDKSKIFCFDWNYEKDKNEINNDIYSRLEEKCMNSDFYGEKEWCYKCKMFKYGFDSSIEKIVINRDNSDPIWSSEWNIRNLQIGSYKTIFARKFCYNRGIREIDENDIICTIADINDYEEEILRTSDKLAYEETMNILNTLKKWLNQNNIILVEEKN